MPTVWEKPPQRPVARIWCYVCKKMVKSTFQSEYSPEGFNLRTEYWKGACGHQRAIDIRKNVSKEEEK